MDHDRSQADKPESSARYGGRPTRITDLPEPILTEVAKRLATENPVETLRKLRNAASHARYLPGGRYLCEYHAERMLDEVAYHPALGEAYTHQAPPLDRNLSSTSGHSVESQSSDVDSKIKNVKESVTDLAVSVMERGIFVDDLMSSIRPIAKSVKEAHDSARAELMSSEVLSH
ncbi:hypothetical protein [Mesorhizobium sp. M0816]|uniref:hypothetical protein n=1 Tax=Mesorhizobium sp. M0816 TaxID=2957006 RepID=UPI00333B04C5